MNDMSVKDAVWKSCASPVSPTFLFDMMVFECFYLFFIVCMCVLCVILCHICIFFLFCLFFCIFVFLCEILLPSGVINDDDDWHSPSCWFRLQTSLIIVRA